MRKDFYHRDKVNELKSNISDLRKELILFDLKEEFNVLDKDSHISVVDRENYINDAPSWLPKSKFERTQTDLIVTNENGDNVIFENYFSYHNIKSIITENGLLLKGSLIKALAGPMAPMQYVQSNDPQLLSIGEVSTVKGEVKATRIDGNIFNLSSGDPIFQGDVIETINDASVGLVFLDKTTMSLSDGGKMVLDELVYNPLTGQGSMAIDMLEGAFSFVSGEIAKTGSDSMTVTTPVATLGIRGTTVAGKAAVEGNENSFTLLQDVGGSVGQISVTNAAGTQTLSQVGATTSITSINIAPPPPIILSPEQIQANYGTVLEVLPSTPAVAPQPESQPEPQEENQQSQEQGVEESGSDEEGEGELVDEVNDENQGDESLPEEELVPDEEISEELSDELDIDGESLSDGDEISQDDESVQEGLGDVSLEEQTSESAQEVFETALADGLTPEEAMAQAVEEEGQQLTQNPPESNLSVFGDGVDFGDNIFGEENSQDFLSSEVLPGENSNENSLGPNSLEQIRGAFSDEGNELFRGTSENFLPNSSTEIYNNPSLVGIGPINSFSSSQEFRIGGGGFYNDSQELSGLNFETTLVSGYELNLFGPQILNEASIYILSNIGDYIFEESSYFYEDASLYENTSKIEDSETYYTDEQQTSVTISGTDSAETLVGTSLAETINGLGGNDTISAGAGNDVIKGGEGIDSLKGGLGDDQFYYGSTSDFYDVIYDFGLGNDTLLFDVTVNHNVYTRSGFINDSGQYGSAYNVDSNGGILPNLINFTTNMPTSDYASKNKVAENFSSFVISGSDYEDVSGTNDYLIVTGDGTNSALYLWQDLFNDHGQFFEESDELTLVALLNDFDNDTLTVSDIMLTPPT